MINTISVLTIREWKRLLKEPSRMMGIILQPLVFLGVLGLGFNNNFYLENNDINYLSYFFPGILALVVLFSAIYSTLSLVEDKATGFFSYVILGPSGKIGAIIGKLFATFSLAFLQSLFFLCLIIFLPIEKYQIDFLSIIIALFFGSLVFSVLGILLAWISPSSSAFHALMSVFLVPMWLLSGAVFPVDDTVFFKLSYLNPMSFLVAILQHAILGMPISKTLNYFGLASSLLIFFMLLIFAIKKRSPE